MDCQKHLFQLDREVHYLNNAYKGPLLKSAEDAAINALARGRTPSNITINHFFDEVTEVKALYAKIINANSKQIAIVPSTSYAFANILNNIKPKPNGNVITVQDEFPSDVFAAQNWCKRNQNQLIFVGPQSMDRSEIGPSWNKNIIDKIDSNTSFVIMSSIHWSNGVKFNLKEIGIKCAEHGAKLVIDGTQSVGSQPIDVLDCKISALVTAAYKWLLGPYTLGMMYLDPSFDEGTPIEESWMNRTNAKNFSDLTTYDQNYNAGAGRFNMGETSNFILMPIAKAGMTQILDWGTQAIQEYDKKLTAPLFEYLNISDNSSFSNHLFSLPIPEKVNKEKLKENIKKNNIIVSQRGESIRVSVNVFNDNSDIQALIKAIDAS